METEELLTHTNDDEDHTNQAKCNNSKDWKQPSGDGTQVWPVGSKKIAKRNGDSKRGIMLEVPEKITFLGRDRFEAWGLSTETDQIRR